MSDHAKQNAAAWLESIQDMWDAICSAEDNNDYRAADDAREELQNSLLSVEVRDGWRSATNSHDDAAPEEYRILLTTGGPALRVVGELDRYGQPETARLEWQDWGTPWAEYVTPSGETYDSTLLNFAQCFYYGDGS